MTASPADDPDRATGSRRPGDGARGALAAAWRRAPQGDRRFYGAALLLWALGLATPPVWGLLDPSLRVSAFVWDRLAAPIVPGAARFAILPLTPYQGQPRFGLDPWGQPALDAWPRRLPSAPQAGYSYGPNRIDDGGRGDDIPVYFHDDPRVVTYRGLPYAVSFLVFALVAAWELRRFLARRERLSLAWELLGAALGGLLVGGATFAGVWLALGLGWVPADLVGFLEEGLLVPLEVAAGAWLLLAATGLLLWVRLRPRAERPPATGA